MLSSSFAAAALSRRSAVACCRSVAAANAPRFASSAAALASPPPSPVSALITPLSTGQLSAQFRSFSVSTPAPTPTSSPLLGLQLQLQLLPRHGHVVGATSFSPGAASTASPSSPLLGSVRGVKTNRAAAKRIRVKGSGGLKRMRAGRRHNTGYLTRKRKNALAQGTGIKGKKHEKRMRRLIGAL